MSFRGGRQAGEAIPPLARHGFARSAFCDEAIPPLAGEEIASSLERAPGSPKKLHSVSFGKKGASALWSYS